MTAQIETLEMNGQPVAIVARLINGVGIGYSICNSKAGDKFNVGRGSEIAIGRAEKLSPLTIVQRLVAMTGHAIKKEDSGWLEKIRMVQERLERPMHISG